MKIKAAIFATLGAFCLGTAAHADTVVYDNGSLTISGGNETVAWVQSENFTLSANTAITGAGVYLAAHAGITSWDGSFQYYIFADASGIPGGILASGSTTPAVTDSGFSWCCGGDAYKFAFNIPVFNAAAGITYWLGIHAGDPTNFNRDDVYWVSSTGNGSANGEESFGGTFNNWSDNGREHAFFLVNGVAAVPEPATWLLMLAGFGMIGFVARRRQNVSVTYA